MDFRDILRIIRKYILIILVCEIVVVGADVLLTMRQPTFYMAYSKVRVRTAARYFGAYEQYPILAEMSALEGYRNVQTQIELMKSGKVHSKPLISHVFPLEKVKEAFDTQLKVADAVKVLVKI